MTRSLSLLVLLAAGCSTPEGLSTALPARVTVRYDPTPTPWSTAPFPNDIFTRADPTSATGVRLNLPEFAELNVEIQLLQQANILDGWGLYGPINIPFTDEIDIASLQARHPTLDTDHANDGIYVINIDPRSPHYGEQIGLDLGTGRFPDLLAPPDHVGTFDPHGGELSLLWNELDEDINQNGLLDPGEDLDADGQLDRPHWIDPPTDNSRVARANAMQTGWDAGSHTLVVRPTRPLDEHTIYAAIVTRRVRDRDGEPVGSPLPWINDSRQTDVLQALPPVLPNELELDDIAFTFAWTTQSITALWQSPESRIEVEPLVGTSDKAIEVDDILARTLDVLFTLPIDSAERVAMDRSRDAVDEYLTGTFSAEQWLSTSGYSTWPDVLDDTTSFAMDVPYWLALPREPAQRAPLIILLPDTEQSRVETMLTSGVHWVDIGFPTVSLDLVRQGPPLHELDRHLLDPSSSPSLADALIAHRTSTLSRENNHLDIDLDGRADAGAYTWSLDPFRTRDVLRQSTIDVLDFIRSIRTAGIANLDGATVIPADIPIVVVGQGQGALVASLVGSRSADVDGVITIGAAARLADYQFLSGDPVVRASVESMMGPTVSLAIEETGRATLSTSFWTGRRTVELPTHLFLPPSTDQNGEPEGDPAWSVGDTLRVVVNDERSRCAIVHTTPTHPHGVARLDISSDRSERWSIEHYRGDVIDTQTFADCTLTVSQDDALQVISRFSVTVGPNGEPLTFHGTAVTGATTAKSAGLGLVRGTSELRRYRDLIQMVLDGADPGVLATLATHAPRILHIAPVGDTSTPTHLTLSLADANRSLDQGLYRTLIDAHLHEGVAIGRFPLPDLEADEREALELSEHGILPDVHHWSQSRDPWGDLVPRLNIPATPTFVMPFVAPSGGPHLPNPGHAVDLAVHRCTLDIDPFASECLSHVVTDTLYDPSWATYHLMAAFGLQRPLSDGWSCGHRQCPSTG